MNKYILIMCLLSIIALISVVSAEIPNASFTTNATEEYVPMSVYFESTSSGTPTGWNWSFGDGIYSEDENVVYTYNTPGLYTIMLAVVNAEGNNVTIKTNLIHVMDIPTPTPTPTPTITSTPTPGVIIPKILNQQIAAVKVETSEKYLQWSFVSTNTSEKLPLLDIYLDDSPIPVITNYSLGTYLQSGLTSGERHTITLYNSTARIINASEPQLIAKATAKTSTADWSLYFVVCLGILLLILLIVLNELVIIVLLGIFAILIDLIGMGISLSYPFIGSIFLGLAIISGIILLIKALPKLRDAISWM